VWEQARDVIGGAGLLMYEGQPVRDWTVEGLRAGFDTERHPRTMIGVDGSGGIWLIAVDGRNPPVSLGMTFAELQGLARALGLRDALNLDGGGSTTMVVRNAVVNHPSDPGGPRRVSDGILVFPAGVRH
jgi:exopolysaccharide biosynthesis protein